MCCSAPALPGPWTGASTPSHTTGAKAYDYIFEVHAQRLPLPRLSSLIAALDEAGYRCFFPIAPMVPRLGASRRRFMPMSGECWRPEFDTIGGWHNVVCVNRKREPELLAAILKLERVPVTERPEIGCTLQKLERELFSRYPQQAPVWDWVLGRKK
jgi:hypothetical protein